MSKPIFLTEAYKRQYLEEFFSMLSTSKMASGEILFKKSLPAIDEKATLYFTPLAWDKMNALIKEFNTEIGWHGLAKRDDDETKNSYTIYDIMVYPQTVTSSTVTTDQSKYTTWLYSQDDDKFNAMRFHGHSHVRMGVTPSATDIDHQTGILSQLEGDMFYIFMIYNKNLEYFVKIYDMKKNILFEKSDVTIKLTGCDYDYAEFINGAKEFVVQNTPTYSCSNHGGSGYGGTGYSGSYNSYAKNSTVIKEEKNTENKPQFSGVKTSDSDKSKKEDDKSKKFDDKSKNDNKPIKKKGTVVPVNSYYGGKYEEYDDYDLYGSYD